MTIRYTVIDDQGCTFTVVLVQKAFLDNRATADQAIHWFQTRRFHMPTALMARDERGIPNAYYGPGELALRLARVQLANLPWQETKIS